jgi:hypothetical protein
VDVSFYTILALKLTLVPALITVASFVGIRWGPAASGWLISLPLTSGPVLFFLAIEQGDTFASTASEGVILGLASITAFALAYVWLALRDQAKPWFYPTLLGWGAFFLATFFLDGVSVPDVVAFAGVVVFLVLAIRVLPKPTVVPSGQAVDAKEIIVRAVAATALVLFITEASAILGPYLSGLLTPFPVYVSVLAASTYRIHGATSAVQLVRGTTLGLFTPAVFCLVIGTTIVGLGIGASFGLAIVVSLPIHGLILRFLN